MPLKEATIHFNMLRFTHSLSAWFFYPIAATFFGAYLCLRHETLVALCQWWLHVMDLPLLISGLLYGGSSVLLSISDAHGPSKGLVASIFLPVILILAAVLFLNFGLAPSA